MRICFITTEYPPDVYWGGIATYVHAMANALAAMGHEVHVVAHAQSHEGTEDGDVHIHWLRGQRPRWLTPMRYLKLGTEWMVHFGREVKTQVRRIRREYGPVDVVESCETQAPAYFIASDRETPVVTHLANPGYSTRQYTHVPGSKVDFWLRDAMERSQTRRSAAVTSPSRIMAEKVAKHWRLDPGSVTVIPNPLPPRPEQLMREDADETAARGPYMIFFGRLQSLKGVHRIAQVLPAILAEHADLNMVFVGRDMAYLGSTMKEYVREQCRGLEDKLLFFERLPKERLMPLVAGARLAVLPSLWEAFGNVFLEAMAEGVITIGTWQTGAQEIIEDGVSGLLVKPDDAEDLKRTMLEALDLPPGERSAMSQAAVSRSRDFAIRKVATMKLRYFAALRRTARHG